jgi:hypothetical protein
VYTAMHRGEVLAVDAHLDAVLASVLDVIDPANPEDAVVWHNGLVATIVLAPGRVVRLDALPVAPAPERRACA